jgi:hypothetical protein
MASHQGAESAKTSRMTSRTGIPHTRTVRRRFFRDCDGFVRCITHCSSSRLASRAFRSARVTSCHAWISARRGPCRRSWTPAAGVDRARPLVYDVQRNKRPTPTGTTPPAPLAQGEVPPTGGLSQTPPTDSRTGVAAIGVEEQRSSTRASSPTRQPRLVVSVDRRRLADCPNANEGGSQVTSRSRHVRTRSGAAWTVQHVLLGGESGECSAERDASVDARTDAR